MLQKQLYKYPTVFVCLFTKPPNMQDSIFDACPKPGEIGQVVPGRASGVKMVEMTEVGAPISLDHTHTHNRFTAL